MIELGDWNELDIVRFSEPGAYLDGGEVGEILMPNAYLTPDLKEGSTVRVFVYLDQQERLVATTETPRAKVGDFAYLECSWTNQYGAFLDWGLMKDLFVPFKEQKLKMEKGRSYFIYIYIDKATRRIVASAKVDKWIQLAGQDYARGRQVSIIVQQRTPLGFKVIVDNAYSGLVDESQLFDPLHVGDKLSGYVACLRPDGKLDISLQRTGVERFQDFAATLYEELRKNGGTLPYSDQSPAEEIARRFKVSKKTFKRAIGTLYREHKIVLHEGEISLIRR